MSNPLRKLVPAPQGAGTAGAVGPARSEGLGTRVHDILHSNATFGPLFVLILAIVLFSITADRFLEPANLSLIVQQVMVVGTLGIAQTLIILTAGIDLSARRSAAPTCPTCCCGPATPSTSGTPRSPTGRS